MPAAPRKNNVEIGSIVYHRLRDIGPGRVIMFLEHGKYAVEFGSGKISMHISEMRYSPRKEKSV